jgi:hypothetical protein
VKKTRSSEIHVHHVMHTQFFRKGGGQVLLLKIRSNAMKFVNLRLMAGGAPQSGQNPAVGQENRKKREKT